MPKKIVKKPVKRKITPKKGKAGKSKKKIALPPKVVKYLEKAGVKHEILEHRTVYTAIDVALTMKKKLNEIAKSLVVKADKDYYLVLLPADNNLDFDKLKKVIGKERVREISAIKIPGEKIIESALKVKAGTLTAFGKLHKVGVVVDKKLEKIKKAVFSSGSANYSIEMGVKDFIKMEEAVLGNFGVKKKIKKQKLEKPKKKNISSKTRKKKIVKKKK